MPVIYILLNAELCTENNSKFTIHSEFLDNIYISVTVLD